MGKDAELPSDSTERHSITGVRELWGKITLLKIRGRFILWRGSRRILKNWPHTLTLFRGCWNTSINCCCSDQRHTSFHNCSAELFPSHFINNRQGFNLGDPCRYLPTTRTIFNPDPCEKSLGLTQGLIPLPAKSLAHQTKKWHTASHCRELCLSTEKKLFDSLKHQNDYLKSFFLRTVNKSNLVFTRM